MLAFRSRRRSCCASSSASTTTSRRYEAFAEQWRAQGALDLAILPDEGSRRRIRDIQGLLERTGAVMLTSRVERARDAPRAHAALLPRVAPTGADRLAQSLTSGIRDLESARPAIGIMHVAAPRPTRT